MRLTPGGQISQREPLPRACPDTDALWQRLATRPGDMRHRLLWLGKMTVMKGFDRLQDLLPMLTDRAVVTLVLGHGLVHHPVALHQHPHVQVVQDLHDNDLPGLYRSADYLLSTSRWEGFGLAIAEALACGTPALLPSTLGTAPELLTTPIASTTWNNAHHLADLLDTPPQLCHPGRCGMTSTDGTWTKPSPGSEPAPEPPRGCRAEPEPDRLTGFHVRWYSHHEGRAVGPFASFDDVIRYMTDHRLPGPDELLVPAGR
ncbi:glycosyltransferase [Streptomyces sp. NPDC002537]